MRNIEILTTTEFARKLPRTPLVAEAIGYIVWLGTGYRTAEIIAQAMDEAGYRVVLGGTWNNMSGETVACYYAIVAGPVEGERK